MFARLPTQNVIEPFLLSAFYPHNNVLDIEYRKTIRIFALNIHLGNVQK
jgi:hypothetical protein